MIEGPEKNLNQPEHVVSPEKKAILEASHKERCEIVQGSFERIIKSAVSQGLNIIPILSESKLTIEVFAGKTLSGKKLSNTDRVLQLATATLATLSNILIYYTAHNESVVAGLGAAASRGAAWIPYLYLAGDEAFDNLKNLAEKHNLPKVKTFVEAAEKYKSQIKEWATKGSSNNETNTQGNI